MNPTTCKHFGTCGGCSFQDQPYQQQLTNKETLVKEHLAALNSTCELKPISSYQPWYYRNKMEFTFSQKNQEVILGLYAKQRAGVFDLKECLIFSTDCGPILDGIRNFVKEKTYQAYDKYSHKGFLRHLIVRSTKHNPQTMIAIVTSSQGYFDKQAFVKSLLDLKLSAPIKSIYYIENDSFGDAVTFQKKELLFGEPFIKETLGEFSFNIGIDTFFQVNPLAVEEFYSAINSYAALNNQQSVLDLFCGTGSIGIFLAKTAKFVWGVELQKEIVNAAWQNAKDNNIENISFFVSDTRKFINLQGAFYKDTETLIMNPPRCGLSDKLKRTVLAKLNPKTIFYSSCNPQTLFSDLKFFLDDYVLELVHPFDFFPHTPHLECLTMLKKK